ncbi:hypothetical protein MARPO_3701s0001 [Marchantia polymorpha]|uniref:Uncharacterized protein n=1 Tax=Marchantia polymorpha TaxID=3197 RepID=A0A2R6VXE2_MARPO|nr:hypothetical protein MARPO_3701s0001 [Marchantia polymorpha]|eukprot:PTQ26268.1 hypothetical protein MARPO_3701s0001 [Marchantia polymorpha]
MFQFFGSALSSQSFISRRAIQDTIESQLFWSTIASASDSSLRLHCFIFNGPGGNMAEQDGCSTGGEKAEAEHVIASLIQGGIPPDVVPPPCHPAKTGGLNMQFDDMAKVSRKETMWYIICLAVSSIHATKFSCFVALDKGF